MMSAFPTVFKRSVSIVFAVGTACAITFASKTPVRVPDKLEQAITSQITILGEVHGTEQAPAFLVEVVRATEIPLRVGLECPQLMDDSLHTYLDSEGTSKDKAAFLRFEFWNFPHDGRSSQAMFEAIEELRKMRRQRPRLQVFCIDSPYAENREREMARLIRKATRHGEPMIVLVGNLHARTTVGSPFDPDFRPMGWWLKRKRSVRSYDMNGASGSAWNCDLSGCGVHPLKGTAPRNSWRFSVFDNTDDRGFSGEFQVGRFTPSFPVELRRDNRRR